MIELKQGAIKQPIPNIPNLSKSELHKQTEELKKITENQQIQIAELKESNLKLQEQIDFAKQEAKSAKKHSLFADAISILALVAYCNIDL